MAHFVFADNLRDSGTGEGECGGSEGNARKP